jgi:hypothetical protein
LDGRPAQTVPARAPLRLGRVSGCDQQCRAEPLRQGGMRLPWSPRRRCPRCLPPLVTMPRRIRSAARTAAEAWPMNGVVSSCGDR